jgi:FkbM family methyltransferase
MVQRVDRPYWFNWLGWHLHQRHRTHKAARRRAVWAFINRIRAMPPGSLAIDAGANVGRVTAALARRGFEVHAFEPDPVAADVFAARFAGRPPVHLHRAAVGARAGTLRLYRTKAFARRPRKATTSSSLFRRDVHDAANAVEVEVVDLVEFIRGLGRPVDVLKLDVEGAEVEILERILDDGLHRRIGIVVAETHERHSPELARRTGELRRRIAAEGIANVDLDWR